MQIDVILMFFKNVSILSFHCSRIQINRPIQMIQIQHDNRAIVNNFLIRISDILIYKLFLGSIHIAMWPLTSTGREYVSVHQVSSMEID